MPLLTTVTCQILLGLDACAAAFFMIIMSDGALGHPSALQMLTTAAVLLAPFLLVAAAPVLLLRSQRPAVLYYVLVLDLIGAGYGLFMAHDFGALAAVVYAPAILACILLLTPTLRTRFAPAGKALA